MHFDDLAPCTYHSGPLDAGAWRAPLRAIGWLEHPHQFPLGTVPVGLVWRLRALITQTNEHFPGYRFRGVHACSLCDAEGRKHGSLGWSQENLIIPGEDEVFAAPGGIVHYVEDHRYLPPAAFIAAALACPDCGTTEYLAALRRANGGHELPLRASAPT